MHKALIASSKVVRVPDKKLLNQFTKLESHAEDIYAEDNQSHAINNSRNV